MLPFDYAKGGALQQAAEFCAINGLEVIAEAESRRGDDWTGYLVVNGFEVVLKQKQTQK